MVQKISARRQQDRSERGAGLAGEPWYQEVIELRKQANDYKVWHHIILTMYSMYQSNIIITITITVIMIAVSGLGDGPGAPSPLPDLQSARGRGDQAGVSVSPRPRRHAQVSAQWVYRGSD